MGVIYTKYTSSEKPRNLCTIGTSSPFSIISTKFFPLGDPDLTSALRRSPVDRWVKPYFWTIFSHCVPFPEPGPPKIQINLFLTYRYLEHQTYFQLSLEIWWSLLLPFLQQCKATIALPYIMKCIAQWIFVFLSLASSLYHYRTQ